MESIYIGLLGLGTVGSGVLNTLEKNRTIIEEDLGSPIRIKRALVKNVNEYGHLNIPSDLTITDDINDILDDPDISIMVEVMGGIHPAKEFILEALRRGKSVVSANKDLVSMHGPEIAEADPTADVGGFDAARKIAILSSIGFRANVTSDDVSVEGIESIDSKDIQFAKEFGYVIKLLAVARQQSEGVAAAVYPAFAPQDHPLAAVRGAYNAVYIVGNAVDDIMFYGKGAGSYPTASAVLGDVLEIADHLHHHATGKNAWLKENNPAHFMDPNFLRSSYYFRLIVDNAPGVLSEISQCFAQDGVSIKTMWQRGNLEETAEIVMVVYPAGDTAVKNVRARLQNLNCVREIANVLRVLEESGNGDR